MSGRDETQISSRPLKFYVKGLIVMYESCCGVRCSECERKSDGRCKGCLNMNKPFWGGECLVRNCCEDKNIDHCGQCEDFPCEMLSNMGKEQGFNPSVKIEQCRQWAAEEDAENDAILGLIDMIDTDD